MARGTVIPRGEDTWRIAIELEPDPLTGKRRRQFSTFRGGKREAEKERTRLLGLADSGNLEVSPKITMAQFLERWIRDYATGRSPATLVHYTKLIQLYIIPHLGKTQLGKLAPTHLVRLFSILRDTDRKDGKGKLSSQTLMHAYRVLNTALESARKWHLIATNPMADIDAPKVLRSEMKAFTIEQAKAFLTASTFEELKWQAFFNLAVTSGLRMGELRGLRWQDVDLNSGMLRVQQAIARVGKLGRVTRRPKTQGSRRPIALGDDIIALLRRHKAEQNQERLALGSIWQDRNLVFASQVGTPLEDKRIREAFHRICDRAEVPRIRPYDLRHSCASLLLAAGINPKVVAERLGHSSVNLTLNTYSHVMPTLQKDAAETLDRMLNIRG